MALAEVDAFDCPRLFRRLDRNEVLLDIGRYQRKLSDPSTHARRASLSLPSDSGTAEVEALLVRNVQDDDDASRCIFFKD